MAGGGLGGMRSHRSLQKRRCTSEVASLEGEALTPGYVRRPQSFQEVLPGNTCPGPMRLSGHWLQGEEAQGKVSKSQHCRLT